MMKLNRKIHYLAPVLTALAAFPIYWSGNSFVAVLIFLLGCTLFLQVRSFLLNGLNEQDPRRTNLSEPVRPKIFSSLDELASGIAHEINNPLAIIAQEAGWMERLLKKQMASETPGEKEIEDCLDSSMEIRRQVDRCNQIVQKLLSMARELNIVIQKIDINEITKNVYQIVTREPFASNIRVNLKLDPNAPPILSDAPLIRQVLLNILMNAKQAVGKGGVIELRTKSREKGWIDIEIQDNGCGICEENLEKIFLPFFSTKQETHGTGLGLAICRGIVEKLGGSITVTSKPNVGTLFTVRLPVTPKI